MLSEGSTRLIAFKKRLREGVEVEDIPVSRNAAQGFTKHASIQSRNMMRYQRSSGRG